MATPSDPKKPNWQATDPKIEKIEAILDTTLRSLKQVEGNKELAELIYREIDFIKKSKIGSKDKAFIASDFLSKIEQKYEASGHPLSGDLGFVVNAQAGSLKIFAAQELKNKASIDLQNSVPNRVAHVKAFHSALLESAQQVEPNSRDKVKSDPTFRKPASLFSEAMQAAKHQSLKSYTSTSKMLKGVKQGSKEALRTATQQTSAAFDNFKQEVKEKGREIKDKINDKIKDKDTPKPPSPSKPPHP